MGIVSQNDLNSNINKNIFNSLYFLYGDEKADISAAVSRLTSKLVEKGHRAFCLHSFDFPDINPQRLSDAVYALPFPGNIQCVRIRDYDAEKAPASLQEVLAALIADLPQSTVLIIYLPTLSFDAKRSAKWGAFIRMVSEKGVAVEFRRQDKSVLTKKTVEYAEKYGCTLSRANAAFLVELCGRDKTRLKNELEKLVFFAAGREITQYDIGLMVTVPLEGTIFGIVDALAETRYERVFTILGGLMDRREEPLAILGFISASYINMYRARAVLDANRSFDTSAKAFGLNPYPLESAGQRARSFSVSQLRVSLDVLYAADISMKSSRVNNRVLLEQALTQLITIKERA